MRMIMRQFEKWRDREGKDETAEAVRKGWWWKEEWDGGEQGHRMNRREKEGGSHLLSSFSGSVSQPLLLYCPFHLLCSLAANGAAWGTEKIQEGWNHFKHRTVEHCDPVCVCVECVGGSRRGIAFCPFGPDSVHLCVELCVIVSVTAQVYMHVNVCALVALQSTVCVSACCGCVNTVPQCMSVCGHQNITASQ